MNISRDVWVCKLPNQHNRIYVGTYKDIELIPRSWKGVGGGTWYGLDSTHPQFKLWDSLIEKHGVKLKAQLIGPGPEIASPFALSQDRYALV